MRVQSRRLIAEALESRHLLTQTVSFTADSFAVSEDGSLIGPEIAITRSSGIDRQQVVVQISLGTATRGYADADMVRGSSPDWRLLNSLGFDSLEATVIRFEDGELTKSLQIDSLFAGDVRAIDNSGLGTTRNMLVDRSSAFAIVDDAFSEPVETIFLRLAPVRDDLDLGSIVEATVNIIDDDDRRLVLNHTDEATHVWTEGTLDDVAVSLNFEPTSQVVLKPSFDSKILNVTPSQLEFTSDNWRDPQYIKLQGLLPTDWTELTVAVDETQEEHEDIEPATIGFPIKAPLHFEPITDRLSVANINPDPKSRGLKPQDFVVSSNYLFFTGRETSGPSQLWRTDGTADGTIRLTNFESGGRIESNKRRMAVLEDELYFVASSTDAEVGLWRSNGTGEGTVQVATLNAVPNYLAAANGALFMDLENVIWVSDGTASGTGSLVELGAPVEEMVAVGNRMFWSTSTTLWVSDGTQAGTRGLGNGRPAELAESGGLLYFAGGDAGAELWKSDGSFDGTTIVKEFESNSKIENLRSFDDLLHFQVGREAWRSDGTKEGTKKLSRRPSTPGNSVVFRFNGDDFEITATWGLERHVANGQSLSLADWPGVDVSTPLYIDKDHFYFHAASAYLDEPELWRSDGTYDGTRRVADINPGPDSSVSPQFTDFATLNGEVYFVANDGLSGFELWKTDEYEATQVYDYLGEPGRVVGEGSTPTKLTAVNDTLFFAANNDHVDRLQLWSTRTDSDEAKLLLAVQDPRSSALVPRLRAPTPVELMMFVPYQDELIFTHYFNYDPTGFGATFDQQDEFDLWRSDGTGAGTELLVSSYVSYDVGLLGIPSDVWAPVFHGVDADGALHLDALGQAGSKFAYTYDGEIAQPFEYGDDLQSPSRFVGIEDKFFFTTAGRDLWVTKDGFKTFTQLTNDDSALPGISYWDIYISEFVEFEGDLFFTDTRPGSLLRTDGTPENTATVFSVDDALITNPTVAGNRLFFTTSGFDRLFASDGTSEGTILLRDFQRIGAFLPHPDFEWCYPDSLCGFYRKDLLQHLDTSDYVELNDVLYFTADDGVSGAELWRSDGTVAGTQIVADIAPGEAGSNPGPLTLLGDRLYFAADDGKQGRELWGTDGTTEGTKLLEDVRAGEGSSAPDELTAVGDHLYFVANDGLRGRELWRLLVPSDAEEGVVGDINGDHKVNFADFLLLSNNFGKQSTADRPTDGDLDMDGNVDFDDFLLLSENYGRERQRASLSSS